MGRTGTAQVTGFSKAVRIEIDCMGHVWRLAVVVNESLRARWRRGECKMNGRARRGPGNPVS